MKITDKQVIESRIRNAGEVEDGLFVFVGQGAHIIDMCVHSGEEFVTINERESTRPYELFEITIVPHREGEGGIYNYSYLDCGNADISNYDIDARVNEYYDNAAEAHARFALLIAEMNHF